MIHSVGVAGGLVPSGLTMRCNRRRLDLQGLAVHDEAATFRKSQQAQEPGMHVPNRLSHLAQVAALANEDGRRCAGGESSPTCPVLAAKYVLEAVHAPVPGTAYPRRGLGEPSSGGNQVTWC
jgi:hypothetical protein